MSESPVTSISVSYDMALITVDYLPNDMSLISDIFNLIAGQNINIDMISQSPPYRGSISLSFTIPAYDIAKAISTLNKLKKKVPNIFLEIDSGNTKLSVYGEKMRDLPGVAARLFTLLADNGIEIKLVTTSEVDISCLIYDKDVDKAIEAIKREYNI